MTTVSSNLRVGVASLAVAAMFAMAAPSSVAIRGSAAANPPPLIGANYSHWGLAGCDFNGFGILTDSSFGSAQIRAQLAAMRAAGIETLRLFIWHMHDATNQRWGVVTSAGGTLGALERSNLIRYVTDVRSAGFKQLSVVFGPMWTNDPISFPENRYDPTLFDENWNLIRSVRPLVKQYGPASTHFDLLNEGGPSDYLATKVQLETYLARMYANYVDAFGNQDVTVSSIVGWNDQSRISNLIDTLRATGRPLPTWFEIHAGGPTLLQDLQATDATLTAKGLSQPLVIGETSYNDPAGANAIKQFIASSSRPLAEVMEWPLRLGSNCAAISVAPPYQAETYIEAVTGSAPPATLTVDLSPRGQLSLKTPYGQPLTALEAGTYTTNIDDASPRENFHLIGHGTNRATSIRGVGTTTWTLKLQPGVYQYRSERAHSELHGTIIVLATG